MIKNAISLLSQKEYKLVFFFFAINVLQLMYWVSIIINPPVIILVVV